MDDNDFMDSNYMLLEVTEINRRAGVVLDSGATSHMLTEKELAEVQGAQVRAK